MNYCRSLKFEEKPDIGYLRKLFKDLFYRMGYEYDFVFDWMVKKQNPSQSLKVGDDENKDEPMNPTPTAGESQARPPESGV